MNRKLLYSIGIGFLVGTLLATVLAPLVHPLIGLGIGVVIGIIAYVLQMRAEDGGQTMPYADSRAYETLLAKARGDIALVERLMRYEKKTFPDAGRAELARRALARWERDSR